MSPERIESESGKATCSSDVWALGIVLHWLLFGEPPFKSQNAARLFREIGSFKVSMIGSSCGEEERALLMRMLDPSPGTRVTSSQLCSFGVFRCLVNTPSALWKLKDVDEKELLIKMERMRLEHDIERQRLENEKRTLQLNALEALKKEHEDRKKDQDTILRMEEERKKDRETIIKLEEDRRMDQAEIFCLKRDFEKEMALKNQLEMEKNVHKQTVDRMKMAETELRSENATLKKDIEIEKNTHKRDQTTIKQLGMDLNKEKERITQLEMEMIIQRINQTQPSPQPTPLPTQPSMQAFLSFPSAPPSTPLSLSPAHHQNQPSTQLLPTTVQAFHFAQPPLQPAPHSSGVRSNGPLASSTARQGTAPQSQIGAPTIEESDNPLPKQPSLSALSPRAEPEVRSIVTPKPDVQNWNPSPNAPFPPPNNLSMSQNYPPAVTNNPRPFSAFPSSSPTNHPQNMQIPSQTKFQNRPANPATSFAPPPRINSMDRLIVRSKSTNYRKPTEKTVLRSSVTRPAISSSKPTTARPATSLGSSRGILSSTAEE
ncbi:hypothetical protein BLNAU_9758 [Blattamonas nauphoetae]|uniref:Protein kinase domain-containing protein n=1 Tax=Blattamonas nauphoetae TaxID=2049346 RepID=A0ABQ9XV53_9EUKA|nr:hypothetical protein BLNAU_9758 [Blattamonas nauphoetae]